MLQHPLVWWNNLACLQLLQEVRQGFYKLESRADQNDLLLWKLHNPGLQNIWSNSNPQCFVHDNLHHDQFQKATLASW